MLIIVPLCSVKMLLWSSVSPHLSLPFFLQEFPGVIPTSPFLEGEREDGDPVNRSESWNPDIVGMYTGRLCVVTHAFALCCSTLHKSSGG